MGLVPLRRGQRTSWLFPPCEDTARQPSVHQENGTYQPPDHADALIPGFRPPGLRKINVCCFSHQSVVIVIAAQTKVPKSSVFKASVLHPHLQVEDWRENLVRACGMLGVLF